jgi:transcriptional regulator NrdR family protein
MTVVKKRVGHTEPFDPNKIRRSIQKAVLDAGYTLDEKKELIDEVSGNIIEKSKEEREIDTETIRNSILVKIDEVEPSIVQSWRRFDSKYKYKKK